MFNIYIQQVTVVGLCSGQGKVREMLGTFFPLFGENLSMAIEFNNISQLYTCISGHILVTMGFFWGGGFKQETRGFFIIQ